jgi:3-methylcrotonyl-CoA carboxylase alpha subunit
MPVHEFHKILIANRGEIAMRVIRAVRELGKMAVVIHSEHDRELPFVTEADEAYSLGSGTLAETYLNIGAILEISERAGVDAIHPGYGFLSENAAFASACIQKNIHFIGPGPEAIEMMGNKSNARQKAEELGLPVLEGVVMDLEELIAAGPGLTYPLLVKPAAGGGGKGMRIVRDPAGFGEESRQASREALSYFGSGQIIVEKYLENPRHIEVQVIADHHGNAVHLFERECSLQRRYQKIIEEAPSVSITPETRDRITGAALNLVRGIGYRNAGTVEFLVDERQEFFFLEMNTRIQVEHPVTEMITGIDLVKEQIRIAEGLPLSFRQEDLKIRGHAIEARIYAEEPFKEFLPSTGRIDILSEPSFQWTRIDNGYRTGNLVEPYYDPMIAKVIATGSGREDARDHLIRALQEFRIHGLKTNRDFLVELLRSAAFSMNRIHTKFIDENLEELLEKNLERRNAWKLETLLAAASVIALQSNGHSEKGIPSPWHSIGHWRIRPEMVFSLDHTEYRIAYELMKGREKLRLHINSEAYEVSLERRKQDDYWILINNQILKIWGISDRSDIIMDLDGHFFRLRRMDILDRRYIASPAPDGKDHSRQIFAPLNGRIVQISVREKGEVVTGDPLLIIESMKMENKILATRSAAVERIHVEVGDQVQKDQIMITLTTLTND